jgi:hypothetical protein
MPDDVAQNDERRQRHVYLLENAWVPRTSPGPWQADGAAMSEVRQTAQVQMTAERQDERQIVGLPD